MNLDIYSHNLTINYSDVDENNQVTNRGLLRLLQEVAGIHCGLLGYGVNDTPKTGLAWILLNWKLKVFARPKTNTNLLIKTWTRKKTPLFIYRDFEVYDNDYNLVAIASSKWVLFNVNNKSISRVTDGVNEKYIQVNKEVFPEKFEEKLKEPLNSKFVLNYAVQRRDIDTNHHVNNLYYLDYAYEALPLEVFKNNKFSNVEIMYKHQATLGDTLSLFCAHTSNNEYIISIKDKIDGKLHAIVKLY